MAVTQRSTESKLLDTGMSVLFDGVVTEMDTQTTLMAVFQINLGGLVGFLRYSQSPVILLLSVFLGQVKKIFVPFFTL